IPKVQATAGLGVDVRGTDIKGVVVNFEKGIVTVRTEEGRDHKVKVYDGAFNVGGKQVTLVAPRRDVVEKAERTASGSVAVKNAPARIARASRILVEGLHDAELVEKVWGDDLRIEGVVVEYLGGVDDLARIVTEFRPGAQRRLGVLVDHLVPGSKEARIAADVQGEHVSVVGHPFVDIWQAVKPTALGIAGWPDVPKGQPWKYGVLTALGWPASSQADVAAAWRHILAGVDSYADLEPELLGRVEELIDFVTAP
ncbi:MAG TPA: DUF3097 family protein, partial [Nocardioidaceae bacterium]|nr:DUF3097 family protein [Nocardioidaceae bacterium]